MSYFEAGNLGEILGINFLLGVARLISGIGDIWSKRMQASRLTSAHASPEGALAVPAPQLRPNIQDLDRRIIMGRRFGKSAIYLLLSLAAISLLPGSGPLSFQVFGNYVKSGF